MKTSLLLRGAVHQNHPTNILIEGNRFKSLNASADTPADVVIDCKGLAILPPFYNAHTHAAMTLLRGYADDMPLFQWLNEYIWPYEARMTSTDIYNGTRLAILEMIKSGCVFFNDMYWEIEETMRAVEEMGIRAAVGVTFMDRQSERRTEENFRFIEQWADRANGRIQITVAPHAIYTVSEALLRRCAEAARSKGLVLHTHLAETEQEVKDCIASHGMTPVRWLDSIGVLGDNVVAAHVVHVDDEEIEILKERKVTIVHNPCSNMKLSSGIFRAQAFSQSDCRIALGTDGASSNNNLDMREEMKTAALLAKCQHTPDTLSAQEVLQWGTQNAAEAFHIDGGIIAEGKLADAVLVNLSNERLLPCHNLISNWVYAADSRCIDTVICDGKIIMEHGRVAGEEEITKAVSL
ncbi:amidohydrolase [Bacteroides sp.]|uniref:amidohydrolase n=1 Tax=Bacteroides sp. TaxID=29523 RepID=UPI002629172B|nr:amidohydrolase [Bacteroides sp.]